MIPFERDPHGRRDPDERSGAARGGRIAPGGADGVLVRELEERRRGSARRAGWGEVLAGWLVAPLCLAAIAAAMLLILRGPDEWFGWAFGGVLGLGLAWILVSSLFPGRPDRTCPGCGGDTLVRLDQRTTRGLRCSACSWRDASASSFLLAEDDGAPLEDIALRERERFRRW